MAQGGHRPARHAARLAGEAARGQAVRDGRKVHGGRRLPLHHPQLGGAVEIRPVEVAGDHRLPEARRRAAQSQRSHGGRGARQALIKRLPSVFISHGSPMHALEAGAAGRAWAALGKRLGKPKALAIASAHWETGQPRLTGADKPETIHDFYGFPEPLYRIRYPASGAPEVAQRAQALLKEGGFSAAIDASRGLDHGAWSPLLYMYPDADVPVVQLSVQTDLGTRHHLAIGKALRSLSDENILVIGSGHLTHHLRDWAAGQGKTEPYAREFQQWVFKNIETHDLES